MSEFSDGKNSIYGYFENSRDEEPSVDPGLYVNCPFCNKKLSNPLKTISFMMPGDYLSYFYRAHKECYENADHKKIQLIESIVDCSKA